MWTQMLFTVLYSFIAGVVGTVIGSLFPMIFKSATDKTVGVLMSFSAGFMLAIVFFDLLPESYEACDGKLIVPITGLILGVLLILAVAKIADKPMRKLKEQENGQFTFLGMMMVLAVGLHNLPEGMAIGSKEAADSGLMLAVMIALHNIPEGIAMSVPFARGGMRPWKIALICALSGVPTIIGAVIGVLVGSIAQWVMALCLAVAAGTMLYVVFGDMLTEAYELWKSRRSALCVIVGILLGYVIIMLVE